MKRISGMVSGLTVGLIIGASIALSTDSRQRRRMVRDSKRAIRRAGHYLHDVFE